MPILDSTCCIGTTRPDKCQCNNASKASISVSMWLFTGHHISVTFWSCVRGMMNKGMICNDPKDQGVNISYFVGIKGRGNKRKWVLFYNHRNTKAHNLSVSFFVQASFFLWHYTVYHKGLTGPLQCFYCRVVDQ